MSVSEIPPVSPVDRRRYEALLDMADLMVHHAALPELFHEIAARLRHVIDFQLMNFSLHYPDQNVMRLHIWEGEEVPLVPTEIRLADSASGWVWEHQEPLLIDDLRAEERFPKVFEPLRAKDFRAYCMLPLSSAQRRLGALGIGSHRPGAYTAGDLPFLRRVAELCAVVVESVLSREALQSEKERLRALVEVNRTLVSSLEMRRVLPLISDCVTRVVPHDFAGLTLFDPDNKSMKAYVLAPSQEQTFVDAGRVVPMDRTLSASVFMTEHPAVFSADDLAQSQTPIASRVLRAGIRTVLSVPLRTSKGPLGTLNVGSRKEGAFSGEDQELMNQVAAQLAIALENARAYEEIESLKSRLEEEKLYLEGEIRSELHFEDIVGESKELRRVLTQAKTVAPSGATVLLLGETGTGKELIARAVHRMSGRASASFIKVNCAAIPTGLLESELFGHEKGAFTGAISQKIGRMELADQGTLFLDEIGEIPLELQPKLLRVLQDHEFERLGSNRTLRVDLRLIAATNRDLSRSVARNEFRSDLFYRLNVFPIRIPPLRDRREDIPRLVRYFLNKLSRQMDKKITTIPASTQEALQAWDWPGNVRELENFIERSVILSEGPVLRAPLSELRPESLSVSGPEEETLAGRERAHIIRVLRECGGQISGEKGAAKRLGLKRTTLQSKVRKLKITRKDYTG